MRTTKTLSVSLAPEQYKTAERLAKKQSRTMSELVREGLRRLEQEDIRGINAELVAALRAVQDDARRAGLDKMTMREINAEIAAARRERRAKDVTKSRK
jgi:Arc/MetJ-type ribon-helix-helix transcriptional regulator